MLSRYLIRAFSALLILGLATFLVGYARYKYDPFSAYRDFVKKPVEIKPKNLKHFAMEEQLIRDKLKLELSKKERSILSGLHWVITLVDDEKNFKPLFADFLLLMDALSNSHGRINQKEVVMAISKRTLTIGQGQLKEIFKSDPDSGWRYIGLFPILTKYPEFESSYFDFYKKQWPNLNTDQAPPVKEFQKAMAKLEYQELFNFLVITSFPHYYRQKAKELPFLLPDDRFPEYLKEFENFSYQEHPINDPQFRSLGYLATHVPLVLTNYGEYELSEGVNMQKVQDYLKASFENARKLGDFDLFAEYIQCQKMYGPDDSPQVKDLEKFIFDLQRPDGSWGSKRDFTTVPYTAIHPSGAALMALNQVRLTGIR